MDLELTMKQTQKLALTPQMEQSLSILQMGGPELEQYMEDTVLSNPMLTCQEPEDGEKEEPEAESSPEWERKTYYVSGEQYVPARDQEYINGLVDEKSCGTSLKEHLRMQLCTWNLKPGRQNLAEYLIECMEESGYLKMSSSEISRILGLTEQEVEAEVRSLQKLEPCGVFARNLRECLLLQIAELEGDTDDLYRLVANCTDEIIHNRIPRICRETGWSREKVLGLIARIKELEPVPGQGYGTGTQGEFIYPDITVRSNNGAYQIILNRERSTFPRINQDYLPLLNREKLGADYEYLQEQYREARTFLKNIERREETLRRVAEAVVERQEAFFEKGKICLSPMNLADIAQDIGMHESTVSRALKDKYLECRWGIFELKYFFSNKGTEKNARFCIEKIVREEDKSNPLSDSGIVRELEKMGIGISRRTVVKYREQLQIPNVRQRKEYH